MGIVSTLTVLAANDGASGWEIFLSLVALLLFLAGVVQLFQRQWVLGIVLFVLACLVGPGGVSLLS